LEAKDPLAALKARKAVTVGTMKPPESTEKAEKVDGGMI
jgi:hypothetical protein